MSRIDDLIAEFAPDGVEYRALGDIGSFTRGRRFTKADQVEVGLPSIHYGEIYTVYGIATDEAVSKVRPDLESSLRFAAPGEVVIAAVGETVEDVGKAVAWLGVDPVAIHDDCGVDPGFRTLTRRVSLERVPVGEDVRDGHEEEEDVYAGVSA